MAKLSLFHLNVVSNYIADKNNYLNLMQVSKKCRELPNYLNQFNAYPPFENKLLFNQKYKPHQFNYNIIHEYYDGTVTNEMIENQPIKTMYLHITPSIVKMYRDLFTGSHECWDLIDDFAELFFNYNYGKDPKTKKTYVHKLYVSKYIAEFDFQTPDQSFLKYINVKNIVIPYGITKIGNGAFANANGLMKIKIPNTVKEIGHHAFFCCRNLRTIQIPTSVTKLCCFCFGHCKKLRSVKIPNSVTEIESYAFYGSYSLTKLIIPTSIQSIGYNIISPIYVIHEKLKLRDLTPIKLIIPHKLKNYVLFREMIIKPIELMPEDYVIYY